MALRVQKVIAAVSRKLLADGFLYLPILTSTSRTEPAKNKMHPNNRSAQSTTMGRQNREASGPWWQMLI